MFRTVSLALFLVSGLPFVDMTTAQEQSVKPGINDTFRNPDVKEFQGRFEVESREVFAHRKESVAACKVQPGQTVADIGAGTGLFTRMFSPLVGKEGRVISVDIAQTFLDHIEKTSREAGMLNIETILGTADSTNLLPESIDVAFICDTYHHFEYPLKTMESLHRALKPGGRVVLVEFRRVEGTSTDWIINHVRAGQEVFESEIAKSGFKKVREDRDLLKENYLVTFEKVTSNSLLFPIISSHGGVVSRPAAAEKPRVGAKVVFDVTADAKPETVNKGLDRAARLLNLYGAAGLKSSDLTISLILHGEATKSALNDQEYKERFDIDQNPNLPLIWDLKKAGVEVFVCGQALNYKGFPDSTVANGITIADAALTVVINKQHDGYSYVPVP